MNQYTQEIRQILASFDHEEDEADAPTSPRREPPEPEVIHVYPTADGGILFSPTELEPEEPFSLESQEFPPPHEDVTVFLFPACVLVLLSLIFFSLLLPTPIHEVSFTVSVASVPLPSVTKSARVKALATGVTISPATTAQGVLTITNGSVIAQQLPAGMIFTGNVEVVTDAPVFVPAGSANGFGVATVSAHALVSGASGNLPADAINSVEGSSLYIRNLQPFTGGRDVLNVPYLTAQDVKRAASLLEQPLQSQTLALFKTARVLNPTCTTTMQSTPQVGQPTQKAEVTVSETCQAVSYRLNAVKTAITSYSKSVGEGTFSQIQTQVVDVSKEEIKLYITATWTPIIVRPYPAGR